jgi:hypothetical protein
MPAGGALAQASSPSSFPSSPGDTSKPQTAPLPQQLRPTFESGQNHNHLQLETEGLTKSETIQ